MKHQVEPRPWALEVEEESIIDGSKDWDQWSTYRTFDNAAVRRDNLLRKGYNARIVNRDTGATDTSTPPAPDACPYCGDHHPQPTNGACLL